MYTYGKHFLVTAKFSPSAKEDNVNDLLEECITKKNSLHSSILDLDVLLAQCEPLPPTRDSSTVPMGALSASASGMFYLSIKYREDEIPKFDGDVTKYPEFKREWQEAIQKGRPCAWIISNLDKRTPSDVSLLNCLTVAECWEELDAVYANEVIMFGLF